MLVRRGGTFMMSFQVLGQEEDEKWKWAEEGEGAFT